MIRLAAPGGLDVAVKRPRNGLFVSALARASIRREYAAYRRLAGIVGIPRAYGLTRQGWLVLEFVTGRPLRDAQNTIVDRQGFYGQLLETIRSMHTAGVAHGDLKRKDNLLVAADGRPLLIDFGIARIRGRSLLDDLLFGFTQQLDLNSWIKLKYGRRPVDLPAADATIFRPLLLERLARAIRIPWQAVTLRRPRQRFRRWLESRSRRQ